ncbi:endonuclease [Mycobacterium phage DS6A]|uniref:Integrase n=1 Tax=Mycobacterium phage DS6A TaxID=45764 RepID=G8I4G6_9CAUD|nr:endonuclease [Mycobacterium phage DS6A]AER47610.1 tyrosine integrase [Mycobacterium phage DS6A]
MAAKGPRKKTGRRDKGDGALYFANGRWRGAVELPTTDGRRRRATVSAVRYGDALAKFRKLRRSVEDGTYAASGNTTVAKWCERWLESIVRPRVRPGTLNKYYEPTVRLHIIPHIGGVRLSKLTPEHVRQLHRKVQAYSTRSAVAAHQVLQKALTDAVREGLLSRNVATLVDKPRHVKQPYGTLAPEDALLLVNTAVDRGDPLAARWAAAFYTGARPAELLGLCWDDPLDGRPLVDLDVGTVELAWQLQNHKREHGCGGSCGRRRASACPKARWNLPAGFEYVELGGGMLLTRPKTKAGWRVVPIAGPLLAMLRAHRATTGGAPNPHGLVWHRDGAPISSRDDHHAWVEACEAAGLAQRAPAEAPAIEDGDMLLTTQEVADALRVSRTTVVKRIADGRLPAVERNGGRWRFVRVLDLLASDLSDEYGPMDEAALWAAADRRRARLGRAAALAAQRGPKEWIVRPPAPYVARHTMATLLQEAGVPEAVAMQITGHSSAVAHRGYVHTGVGVKRAAIEALEAVYDDGGPDQ